MFSLITIFVAIVLFVVLVLATQYHGGSIMSQGEAAAKAAKLVNQGTQILAAAQVYYLDHRKWPNSIDELVTTHYLSSYPLAMQESGFSVIPSAVAADSGWVMPTPGVPTFKLTGGFSSEVCKEVNKMYFGNNGIPAKAYPDTTVQCYGAAEPALTVVISSGPDTVQDAVPSSDLGALPRPLTPADSGWWIPPGTPLVDGTSSGDTGGTGDPVVGPFSCPATIKSGVPVTCTAVLTNAGTGDAAMTGTPTSNDADLTPSSDCPATLVPGASCTLTVSGTPTVSGPKTVTISWALPWLPWANKSITTSFDITVSPAETVYAFDDFMGTASYIDTHVGPDGTTWTRYQAATYPATKYTYWVDGLGHLVPQSNSSKDIIASGIAPSSSEYFIELTLTTTAGMNYPFFEVGTSTDGVSLYKDYLFYFYTPGSNGTMALQAYTGPRGASLGPDVGGLTISPSSTYTYRFEFYRNKKRVLINGQLVAEYADPNPLPSGHLYFSISNSFVATRVKMASL